jgi:hypothetical protein
MELVYFSPFILMQSKDDYNMYSHKRTQSLCLQGVEYGATCQDAFKSGQDPSQVGLYMISSTAS